jgi:hypothetical protein
MDSYSELSAYIYTGVCLGVHIPFCTCTHIVLFLSFCSLFVSTSTISNLSIRMHPCIKHFGVTNIHAHVECACVRVCLFVRNFTRF